VSKKTKEKRKHDMTTTFGDNRKMLKLVTRLKRKMSEEGLCKYIALAELRNKYLNLSLREAKSLLNIQ
jgi:hypothetical protein